MANLKRISDILFSSWVLANDKEPLPTGNGILDRALEHVVRGGAFPEPMRKALHFVPTSVGWRCAELRSILAWAQAADQTTDPNPTYMMTQPKGGASVARGLLFDLGIPENEALEWGRALAAAIQRERSQMEREQA
jgi:hypothetical protein